METPFVPVRAKRGCLWYAGVTIASAFGLFTLLVATIIIYALNAPSQRSIVVSDDDNTSLEAETTNHGEGFLDGYDWLEVYYVRRSWFWSSQRVRVYNFPHNSADGVGFRRFVSNGNVCVHIKQRNSNGDSTVLATFVPPASFPEK